MNQISRREMIKAGSCGFASLALAGICAEDSKKTIVNPLAARKPMFPAKAKRVIFIFMGGGPSHVDTFDYKPELFKADGKEIDFTGVRFKTFGKASKRQLMKPLWNFKQHGKCGRWVSELFPHQAQHVDKMCMIHSMHTEGVAHGPSTLFLHTGATNTIRPSMGSWINYGLGTENKNLPGFVSIMPAGSNGGPRNYSNAFLPTIYQGTALGRSGNKADQASISHIKSNQSFSEQSKQFKFLQSLNHSQLKAKENAEELEAVISSYELAYRMQMHAPKVIDISTESKESNRTDGPFSLISLTGVS